MREINQRSEVKTNKNGAEKKKWACSLEGRGAHEGGYVGVLPPRGVSRRQRIACRSDPRQLDVRTSSEFLAADAFEKSLDQNFKLLRCFVNVTKSLTDVFRKSGLSVHIFYPVPFYSFSTLRA